MADTEREAFEAWARDPIRAEKLPLDRWPTNDGYKDTRTYTAFYGWKAGRAALASRPAEVDDTRKPPSTPEEMVAFIGNHYNAMLDEKADPADIEYALTVHDLLSAMGDWFEEEE